MANSANPPTPALTFLPLAATRGTDGKARPARGQAHKRQEKWSLRRGPQEVLTAVPMGAAHGFAPRPRGVLSSRPFRQDAPPAAAQRRRLHRHQEPDGRHVLPLPRPDEKPFVKEGDRVSPETVVCLIEAMKFFNQIKAECTGTIVKVLANDGDPVELRPASVQDQAGVSGMFQRILIANRGEIALRIIRACREMGIETVAVFSEADRGRAYLDLADEAYCIGPARRPTATCKIDRIISAAEVGNVGGDSSRLRLPGRERATSPRCAAACKIEFIGPPHEAMDSLGDKVAARANRSSKPRCRSFPAATGLVADEDEAVKVAARDRLSRAHQGDGRRRRQGDARRHERTHAARPSSRPPQRSREGVQERRRLHREIHREAAARRSADARRQARQRRPPLGTRLHDAAQAPEADRRKPRSATCRRTVREEICKAAVRLAKTAGYTNAGTCEFIVDQDNKFYFIEVNARIQVEHPVTEHGDRHRPDQAADPRSPPARSCRSSRGRFPATARAIEVPHQRRGPRERTSAAAPARSREFVRPAAWACGSTRTPTKATRFRRTTTR